MSQFAVAVLWFHQRDVCPCSVLPSHRMCIYVFLDPETINPNLEYLEGYPLDMTD